MIAQAINSCARALPWLHNHYMLILVAVTISSLLAMAYVPTGTAIAAGVSREAARQPWVSDGPLAPVEPETLLPASQISAIADAREARRVAPRTAAIAHAMGDLQTAGYNVLGTLSESPGLVILAAIDPAGAPVEVKLLLEED